MTGHDNGETHATIEDCLGTAIAVIRQDGDVLTIIKTYDPESSDANHNYPIYYEGHWDGNRYRYTGSFIIDGGHGSGKFEMWPFPTLTPQ
jgi:hypothetical protein